MKMAVMVKGEKHFLYSLQREGEGLHDRKSLLKCQERIPGCFLQKLCSAVNAAGCSSAVNAVYF